MKKTKRSMNNGMAVFIEALDYYQKKLQEIPNDNVIIKANLTNGAHECKEKIIQMVKETSEAGKKI